MITVEASRTKFSPAARHLRRILAKVLSRLTKRPVHIGVFLVSDEEMKRVNRTTRRKNAATNVLSFTESGDVPHPELPKGARALGEIFLAPDYIARKGEDITTLLIHGLLHLFGYTHRGRRDRIEMETKEDELNGLHRNRIGRRLEHGTRGRRRRGA